MDFIEKLYHNDISGTDIGELRLFLCGKRTDAPNHRFGPAARDNFWLIYLRDGAGVLEVGRHSCRIGKGDIFVVYPNRRTYYRADNGSVWTLYWLSLAAPLIEEVLPLLGISEDSPVKSVDDRVSIEETFELLLEQFELETPEAKLRCQSLVYKLLSFLTVSGQTAKPRDYIDEAILYITSNFDRRFSVGELAAGLNIDKSYFCRLFKQRQGLTPTEWLTEYRLKKAVSLLQNTDLRIKEIALSVGFDDQLYFTRRFKRRFGTSPTAFRERMENHMIN